MVLSLERLTALDRAHRLAQARNAAAAALLVGRAWQKVDADRLAATSSPWLADSLRIIEASHQRSQGFAGLYAEWARTEQAPDLPSLRLPPAPSLNVEQVRTSLIYLGPSSAGRSLFAPDDEPVEVLPGIPLEQSPRVRASIMERAATQIIGATIRYVQNGGRDFLDEVVDKDAKAVGYVRITGDNPCAFCAMLASRGPVYKDTSFNRSDPRFEGLGDHKVHDHCGCTIRPLYSKSRLLMPQRNQDFENLWAESTRGYSQKDTMNAFRRAYERPALHLDDVEAV